MIEDREVGRERVGEVLRPDELEVVGGGVVPGKLAVGRAREDADGQIEARRAVLPLVVAERGEVAHIGRRLRSTTCAAARSTAASPRRLRL